MFYPGMLPHKNNILLQTCRWCGSHYIRLYQGNNSDDLGICFKDFLTRGLNGNNGLQFLLYFWFHYIYVSLTRPKAKPELGEDSEPNLASCFSPETVGLIQGLGDSPESLALKSEYLKAFNELQRGPLNHFCMVRMFNPSRTDYVIW